ncbi:MAG TPA: hypothetical protein VIS57_07145, partial [Xanthomonadales bacterium]
MINLRILCATLILLSLAACDDKAAQPAATATAPQQDLPANDAQTLQGIEQMKAKLQMNPNDFETLSILADMYFESSLYVEAFQTYDKALAINPMC